MKTLKLALGLCLLLSSLYLSAQSNHEIGLRFSGLNNLDFMYKKGKTENKFTRFTFGMANFEFAKAGEGNKRFNADLRFSIGFEKRKRIKEDLFFIHGFQPGLSVLYNSFGDNRQANLRPSLRYILGFHYDLSDKFAVSVETVPGISGSFLINDQDGFIDDNYSINLGFNSAAVLVGLVYTFSK